MARGLEKNIGYAHIEKLGGGEKKVPNSQHMITADGKTGPRPYADYMPTSSFKAE